MPVLAVLPDSANDSLDGLGFYYWDVEADVLHWSKGLLKVYGLSSAPAGEFGFYDLLHPDDRVRVEAETTAFLQAGNRYEHRFRIMRPNGGVCVILDRGVIERRSDGTAAALRGVNIEIGVEQDHSADAPRDEAFRLLADNIDQFAWIANASGWIYWYNQRWLDYTGASLEDMAGWGWRMVHHPAHVDRVVEKISACFKSGEAWQDVFPLRGKDGGYRWFLSRALPVKNAEGAIQYWFGTNTDITEQRRNEAHFTALAESVPQLVWTANADGEVTYYNSRIGRYGDAREPQSSRWDWPRIVHPEDFEGTVAAWQAAYQSSAEYSHSHRLKMVDGTYRWHLSRAFPLTSDDGKVERWFGTATDIDELTQAQLLRQAQLDEANHRIKNMLTMIQSIARLSMRSNGEPEQRFDTFLERLDSFAAAHSVLVNGPQGDAALFDLINSVTTACSIDPERISKAGENPIVSSNAGVLLALAVHELCTNAIKYGALRSETGRIDIDCKLLPNGRHQITWAEHGGPAVVAPDREGLGSRLIKHSLASVIRGSAVMRFEPSGLVCTIEGALRP